MIRVFGSQLDDYDGHNESIKVISRDTKITWNYDIF
jgi:hypothetical protein